MGSISYFHLFEVHSLNTVSKGQRHSQAPVEGLDRMEEINAFIDQYYPNPQY